MSSNDAVVVVEEAERILASEDNLLYIPSPVMVNIRIIDRMRHLSVFFVFIGVRGYSWTIFRFTTAASSDQWLELAPTTNKQYFNDVTIFSYCDTAIYVPH